MKIEDLEKIKKVEVPPFLYTRIEQKIANLKTAPWPRKVQWAMSFVLGIVLFLNIYTLVSKSNQTKGLQSYSTSLNLNPDNELYK